MARNSASIVQQILFENLFQSKSANKVQIKQNLVINNLVININKKT